MSQNHFEKFEPGVLAPWRLPEYPDSNIYVHVPDCYSPDRPIGLFFFMHGGDTDSPVEAPYEYYLEPKEGRLTNFIKHIPFITVAPTSPYTGDPKRWNNPGVCEYIEKVMEDIFSKFNIDRDRMILGGHSMGGFGGFHVGSLMADRFAGIWISAGAWKTEDFRSFLGTPVYLSHGKYDCAAMYHESHITPRHHDWCGTSFSRAAHELMLRDDVEHIYDEHEGGHSLGWEASQMSIRRFFNWAERQRRQPSPRRCALITPRGSLDPVLTERPQTRYLSIDAAVPGEILQDKIYLTGPNIAWTIDEFNAQSYYMKQVPVTGSSLIAEIGDGNQISLEALNVTKFTIHLNDKMVDLSQKIRLNINGRDYNCTAEKTSDLADYQKKITLEL